MSWSVNFIGRPSAVKRAIEAEAVKMTGQSKVEYDAVKPHLLGMIEQCVGEKLVVKLIASGHGQFEAGKKTYGTCAVDLQQYPGFVE